MGYQDAVPPEGKTGLDVAHSVADVQRLSEIYCRNFLLRSTKKQVTRLSALAFVSGSMRTEIACIDVRIVVAKQLIEPDRNGIVIVKGEESPPDSRLIRHHDHRNHLRIDPRDRICRSIDQPHLLGPGEIVCVVNDRPVPVEKHGSRKKIHASAVSMA